MLMGIFPVRVLSLHLVIGNLDFTTESWEGVCVAPPLVCCEFMVSNDYEGGGRTLRLVRML